MNRICGRLVALAIAIGLVGCTTEDPYEGLSAHDRADAIISDLGIAGSYPFEHHFLEVTAGDLHYVDEGKGDPVLMLHGNPTWSYLYREFVPALSKTNRVIVPDHIGFGLSSKPRRVEDYSLEMHAANIEALLIALDLWNVTLVIHDWGGPIELTVSARNPERIKALVVLNTFGFYPPLADMDPENIELPFALKLMRSEGLGHLLVRQFGMFESVVMKMATADQVRLESAQVGYRGVFRGSEDRAGVLAFPRMIPTKTGHPAAQIMINEIEPFLENFGGPVQIYWGMEDPFFVPDMLAEWKKRLPQSEIIKLVDAKHYVQEDAFEIIVPGIERFLKDISGSNALQSG